VGVAAKSAGDVFIDGTASGAGGVVAMTIRDADNNPVETFSTFANANWSVFVSGADFAALTDGSTYTITAQIADAAGNATTATHSFTVDETAPTAAHDTNVLWAGATVAAATPAQGVLGNDSDPEGGPLNERRGPRYRLLDPPGGAGTDWQLWRSPA
jgi:hypothetical protein